MARYELAERVGVDVRSLWAPVLFGHILILPLILPVLGNAIPVALGVYLWILLPVPSLLGLMGPQPQVPTVVNEPFLDRGCFVDLGTQSGTSDDTLVVLGNGQTLPTELQ